MCTERDLHSHRISSRKGANSSEGEEEKVQGKTAQNTHCLAWKPENSKAGSSEYYVLIQKCELSCIRIKKNAGMHCKELGSCYKFPAVTKA